MLQISHVYKSAILAVTLGFAAAAPAVTQAGENKDFSTLSCKDVMLFSGTERETAIAFLHGYRLGKKGTTQYSTETMSKAADEFVSYCLDNPKKNALKAFTKFTK